jgi:predicted ArsR family transcriptional regulator
MQALARNSDPSQCHEAADRARRFAPSHHDRILAALTQHGPRTAHELEGLTGLNYVQIDRRMHELRKDGKARAHCVCIDGQRIEVKRGTPSGGQAQVWEAV